MMTLFWGKVFRKVNSYQGFVGKRSKEQGAQLSLCIGSGEAEGRCNLWPRIPTLMLF